MAIEKSELTNVMTAHWDGLQRQTIQIKQWANAEIYFDPLSGVERDQLDALECGPNEYNIQVLVKKAQKEDGSPFFTKADLQTLRTRAAPAVITLIAMRILTADLVDIEKLGEPSAPQREPDSTPATP